ncbi:MAG TPA: SUF system NifU family Fe-S cluster assembly protein [Woeseiaceae bacterium]|nr:SUF system NifU family Fe-S cluster assembly protein [Woeseiaceae bacterium]
MSAAMGGSGELRELYRELILDHAKCPRHFGRLEDATHSAEGVNPLCGDKLKVYFRIDEDDRISDARFEGSGCAISVASASLLMETVIGLKTDRALAFFAAMIERLASRTERGGTAIPEDLELGKLEALEGVKEFPTRVKCATLAWHALHAALQQQGRISTE